MYFSRQSFSASTCILIIALLLCVGAALLLHVRGVNGFNYRIYNYFSSLYFFGKDPYKAPDVKVDDVRKSFRRPSYLDYTGLQLTIYNICYAVKRYVWWRLDGFVIYSLSIFILTFVTLYLLHQRGLLDTWDMSLTYLLLFNPYLWHVLFFRSYEDKAIFLLIPPLLILLAATASEFWSFFVAGLLTGWLGVPVLLLPLMLIDAHRHIAPGRKFVRCFQLVGVFLLGCCLALIPFFPDALEGWKRRSLLEGARLPYWFSFWNLFGPYYFANLNKLTIAVVALAIYGARFLNRLSFRASLVLLVLVPMFFSITMGSQRIVPIYAIMLLGMESRRSKISYVVLLSTILCVFLGLDIMRSFFMGYPKGLGELVKPMMLLSPGVLASVFILKDRGVKEHALISGFSRRW